MATFDPGKVLMGQPGTRPYMQNQKVPKVEPGKPIDPGYNATLNPGQPGGVLGSESVRATGSGPFDSAYRQNLATYSGGNFMRPGGNMSFNPTDASTFPGNPTGGGTAPLPGLPDSLISRALGGNPFMFSPPNPASTTPDNMGQPEIPDWRFWLRQIRNQGGGYSPYLQ